MEITTREVEGFHMAVVHGDVDFENVIKFENHLTQMVDQGCRHLVVNLSKARYLSSLGLNALVKTWHKLARVNGSLNVISQEYEITKVLLASNLQKIIPLHRSEEEFTKAVREHKMHSLILTPRSKGKYRIIDIYQPITVLSGYRELAELLQDMVETGNNHIAVAIHSIKCISSEFVGLLSKWGARVRQNSGCLCLIGLDNELKKRFAATSLGHAIAFCECEDQLV